MKPSVPPRSCGALLAALVLFAGISSLPAYFSPDSFFDVFLESSSAPPYPPANGVGVNLGAPGLPFTPIASTSLKLNSVSGSPATVVSGSDSGGGPGDAGLYSFFDIFLESPMTISSFFDIFTEMSLPGGAPLPIADTPTVVWHADSFFDVFLECDIPGQGRQAVKMEFRIPTGQTAQFAAPPTIGNSQPGVNSFFDVFLEVAPFGGPINPQLPVVRVIMTGSLGWPQPWTVPGNVTKFRQNPDPSIRGLDVLDSWRTNEGPATLLADDFICTRTGPVTDIHIWGSWLNDLVDHWPTFWVGIWSDVPRSNNIPSHPGELLWSQQFSPGEYRASVQQTVPQEWFLDPNAPPAIIGQDHQIWKYDFFPRNPFRQLGSPQLPKVYWLSVVTKTAPGRVFGWKTTPDHYNDFAVYAPTTLTFGPGYPMPQSPWQVIVDPQGRQRELSFMLTTSQRWACNKDFWNPWPYALNNVRVVLPGPWGISGNFNGVTGGPQFNTFTWDWNATGQTLMDWSDGVVSQGEWVHIGFEGPGEFPPFLNWGWWNPFMGNWWGMIPQFSIGWQGLLLPAPIINFTNILPIVPSPTNNLFLSGLTIEYYTNAIPLDSLNRTTTRSPFRVDTGISIPSPMVAAGGDTQVSVPAPPPEATHAVVIPTISPVNEQGLPNPEFASVDWAMVPLTQELPPTLPAAPVLQVPQVAAGNVTLTWTAEPGAIYRVQTRTSLTGDMWTDVEGDEIAGDSTASKTVSVSGQTSFYRVLGLTP
ncbi:MAG: hypothetical protein MUE94_11595 [Verrucomicrobia bacterium]|jgi:hypothetical protein|nr:hypothetical protein [Verrucomicrobiota bacterium]